MPIFEFKCEKCKMITEKILSIKSTRKNIKCPYCKGQSKRIVSINSGYIMDGYSAKNGYSKGEK